jgi:hypothetical protein
MEQPCCRVAAVRPRLYFSLTHGILHFHRLVHQLPHPHRAIEEQVFGVEMEVNEGIARHL